MMTKLYTHCLQNLDLCIRDCFLSSLTLPNIIPKSKWLKLKTDIRLLSTIPEKIWFKNIKLLYILTNHISKGPNLLIFLEAKQRIYPNQECHDSIIVYNSKSRAELPTVVVVGEHPGSKNNESEGCITNHFEEKNCKHFYIQGFVFACVPEFKRVRRIFLPLVYLFIYCKFWLGTSKARQNINIAIQLPELKILSCLVT